jgi:DNA-binding NarL/FixJ family response regulator
MIRVLLVEDHKIVRQGLRALLDAQPDIEVVGEAEDGRSGLKEIEQKRPDIAILDLGMPKLNGIDATKQIIKLSPETKVIVLSMHAGDEYVRPAIRAGASGYLLKGSGLSDLVSAIYAIHKGEAFFSPSIAKILLQDVLNAEQDDPENTSEALSDREREILQMIAEGYSSPQIARSLFISIKTVETHRSRIMKKLNIHNIAGLVRYAVRIGLVSTEP